MCGKEEFAMTLRNQTSTPEMPVRHDTPDENEIRARAYELYEERGRENGHDVDDWLRAKTELSTQKRKGFAA